MTTSERGREWSLTVADAEIALDGEERLLLDKINDYRRSNRLAPLTADAALNQAAAWMSADMDARNLRPADHKDSTGRTAADRVRDCGNTAYLTENIYSAWFTGADPGNATQPTFSSESARRSRSKELFTQLDSKYGSTATGRVAKLYLAQIAVAENDKERARELWKSFLDAEPEGALAAAARINLYKLDREQGRGAEIAAELQKMLDQDAKPLPGRQHSCPRPRRTRDEGGLGRLWGPGARSPRRGGPVCRSRSGSSPGRPRRARHRLRSR